MSPLVSAIMSAVVQLLIKLIPALSGGFWGLLLGWAVPFLSGWLITWLEKLGIKSEVNNDLATAKYALNALEAAKSNPAASKEDIEKARIQHGTAVGKLGRIRLR